MDTILATGYTPTVKVKPATKEQLIALRDCLLEWHDTNAAAAVDNVIDILSRAAYPTQQTRDNVDPCPACTARVTCKAYCQVRKQYNLATRDPRTPEQKEDDMALSDWQRQVTEYRGG